MITRWFKVLNKRPFITVVALLPVLLLGIMLVLKSVNVPNSDEWELVPIFQHIHTGHIYWMDFWRQHNEHRIIIPNIVLVTTAYFTHWNLIVENFINIVIAIASFSVILKVLKITGIEFKQKSSLVLIFLVSLIWFSLVQSDNWLWGWEIEWFLNVLGVTVVAYCLSRLKAQRLGFSIKHLGLLLLGGVIAQYSLGNGTLIWPILVIVLLFRRIPLKQIAAVFLTGSISTLFYYLHYTNLDKGSLKFVSHNLIGFAKYFFTYLGGPLGLEHRLTPILGLVLFMVFVGMCTVLITRQKELFNKLIPWVCLGLYAIGSAFITGLARLSLGPSEAASSRYTTIASLLLISVVVMLYHCRGKVKSVTRKFYPSLAVVGVLLVFSLVLLNDFIGFRNMNDLNRSLKAQQQCTHLLNPTTACLLSTYPNPTIVSGRLNYLKQVHWAGY